MNGKDIIKITIFMYLGILCFAAFSSALGYSVQPHWISNLEDATLFIGDRQVSSFELFFLYGLFCFSLYQAIVHLIMVNKTQNVYFIINILTILVFSIFLFPEIITIAVVWPVILISWINQELRGGFITMSIITMLTVAVYSFIIRTVMKSVDATD